MLGDIVEKTDMEQRPMLDKVRESQDSLRGPESLGNKCVNELQKSGDTGKHQHQELSRPHRCGR